MIRRWLQTLVSSARLPRRTTEGSIESAPPTFEEVYRDHFPFVWRSLRRLGIPEADVFDAAQDVFLIVHRKLGSFDFAVPATTWLYAVCLRVASDRRRCARTRYEIVGPPTDDASVPSDAEDAVEVRQRRRLLDAALDAMPLEQRAVFTLFELDEWPSERIAELLDIPPATVHSRLRLARAVFRSVVERHETREAFLLRRMGLSHE